MLCFWFVAISVSFSQKIFSVNERDGVAAPVLTLSKPSPCCLHLRVEVEDITATSKLVFMKTFSHMILLKCLYNFRHGSLRLF